jgi:hypothetical protein
MPQTTQKKAGRKRERNVTEDLKRRVEKAPSWLFIALGVVVVIAISYAAGWNDDIEDIIEDNTREGYSTEFEDEVDAEEMSMSSESDDFEEDDEDDDEEDNEFDSRSR